MAVDREVKPDDWPHLTPLDYSEAECALCGYKASATTPEAAKAAFRDHEEWHRSPKPTE